MKPGVEGERPRSRRRPRRPGQRRRGAPCIGTVDCVIQEAEGKLIWPSARRQRVRADRGGNRPRPRCDAHQEGGSPPRHLCRRGGDGDGPRTSVPRGSARCPQGPGSRLACKPWPRGHRTPNPKKKRGEGGGTRRGHRPDRSRAGGATRRPWPRPPDARSLPRTFDDSPDPARCQTEKTAAEPVHGQDARPRGIPPPDQTITAGRRCRRRPTGDN